MLHEGNRRAGLLDRAEPFVKVLTCILFACLASCSSHPVARAPHISARQRCHIEAAVTRFMAARRVPGIAIGAVTDGRVAWTAGFGVADLENPVPVTDHTLFRLGSVSKSLTATAALQLWERQELDLDAPVQQYCPAFPEKPWPVSTRQVLAHIGGIRHYRSEAPDDPEIGNVKHCADPIADGLRLFADDPLVAQPGTDYRYSTQGYTLAGCVLEGASRGRYVDLVRARVLIPAGMSETIPDDRLAIIARRTRFYRADPARAAVVNADPLDSCYKIPGGGWLSSAADMALFEVALLNDLLVRRDTREVMWTPLRAIPKYESGYALGWITKAEDGVATVGHTGEQQGASTALLMAPGRRAGVVVLANMEKVPVRGLAREILTILLDQR